MSSFINHGIIDLNCKDLLRIATQANKSSAGFERNISHYNNNDKYWNKISKFYKDTGSNYQFFDHDWASLIPDTFFSVTKLKKEPITVVVNQILPGKLTPPHVDNYGQIPWKQSIEKKDIARFWIPLTKPSLGHALFFDDAVLYNLQEGTIIEICQGQRHSACNAGDTSRFFMSIIGVRENSST
tara:strand:- start:673 stop:1224 length:552 start_codon:yes stop_codon:yes gene_type:complete